MPEQQQQQQTPEFIFEPWAGMNTAPQRAGVAEQQAFWLDNFMPLAERRLRALPDVATALYTAAVAGNILAFYSYNIGPTSYFAVFGLDGSLTQVNVATGAATTILAAGSIFTPNIAQMGIGQYGQQYLLAVANQTNGYWVWDGSAVYTAGTIAPGVVITNAGLGYATAPNVQAQGGHGTGAQFVAIVQGGAVTNINITNPGSGYLSGDTVTLVFTGGTKSGSGATLTAGMVSVSGGVSGTITPFWSVGQLGSGNYVATLSIVNAGVGYGPLVAAAYSTANGNWQNNAPPALTPHENLGTLSSVSVMAAPGNASIFWQPSLNSNGLWRAQNTPILAGVSVFTVNNNFGIGFTANPGAFFFNRSNPSSVPLGTSLVNGFNGTFNIPITISNPLAGTGLVGTDNLVFAAPSRFPSINVTDTGFFSVNTVTINNAGSGYGPNISITASGGGAPIGAQGVFLPTTTNGSLTSVFIASGGVYGASTAPTLTVTDSATTAAATVNLMPFGVSGNAVQTYAGHVWVFNGNVFTFSAAGSVSNFATSAGGGQNQSNSNYLKVGYTGAVSANGFLFLVGDSSMDYISGVVTSGSVATTTFTQNNSDPDIGTPYAAAITTLGSEIFIANSIGIFVSQGGTFKKISDQLDGIWQSVPALNFNNNPFNGFQISVAKATIFNKRVWLALIPIVDPISGLTVNKLMMVREKKIWWAGHQSVPLNFIASNEINSVYTAYGTDGNSIYQLFSNPSGGLSKIAQSRMADTPGGINYTKAPNRFWSTWFANSTVSTSISLTVESNGIGAAGAFTATQGYSIAGPSSIGYYNSPQQAIGQQGVFVGITLQTSAADMELVTAKVDEEVVGELV